MTTQNVFEKFFSSIFGGSDDDAVEQKAQLRPKARPEGLMSSLRPKSRPTSEETEEPDKDATMGFVNKMLPYYSRKSNTTAVLPFSASRQAFMNNSTLLEELQAQREASVSGLTTVTARSGGRYSPIDTLLANSNKFIDDEADDLAFKTRLALGRKPEVKQPMVDSKLKQEFDPKSIQQNLVDKGYKIAVDGIIGTQTKKAIKDFQRKSGLKDDGIVGPNTARALGFDSSASEVTTETLSPADIPEQIGLMERLSTSTKTPFMAAMASEAPTINITKDDRNTKEGIKKIQGVLNILGYSAGTEDGISGDKTKAAIKQFQKDNKLSPDAVVGNATAEALNKANQSSVSDDVKTDSIIKNIPLPEGVKKSLGNINTVLKAVLSPVGRNFITDMLYGGKLSYANPLKAVPFLSKQETAGAEVFSQEAINLMKDIVLDAGIVKKGSVTIGDEIYKKAGNISVSQRGGSSAKEIIEALAEGDPINELKLMLGQFSANIDENNDIIVTDRFNYNAFINPIDNKKYTPEQYDKAIKDGKFTEAEVLKSIFKGDFNYKTIRAVGFVLGSKDYEGKDNPKDQGRRFKINLGPAN